ncbi:MAG TPA: glycosyltransferase family 4 protein [Verrucomicrobiae bacterium]|nr:glycosyltransferase family 4 protein [Verrucomicrobiae bacterium]
MRALLIVRPSVHERGGGDMVQALYTKRGLEAAGVEANVVSTLEPVTHGYDVAHVFGVFDPEVCAPQMAACKRAGIPVALSPIWYDLYEYYGRSRAAERILAGPQRRIERELARLQVASPDTLLRRNERRKYAKRVEWQTALMREAGVLLPNSAIEAHALSRRLRLHDRPIVVVHNAFDPPSAIERGGARSGVVCVARIEEVKNQAMLLYALQGLDADVTLVGLAHQPHYSKLCRRFVTPRVHFAGVLPHAEVFALLARSAVHVLPSYRETPGIVSLEAAAAGARVIVSNDGTEREYFGELADYVDPLDPRGIRCAVERALALPPREPGDELDRRIAAFTARNVGERTLAGYRIALGEVPCIAPRSREAP